MRLLEKTGEQIVKLSTYSGQFARIRSEGKGLPTSFLLTLQTNVFIRTMELAILLVLISGVLCREHARHLKHSHLKDVHSAKKFNIVTHSKNEVLASRRPTNFQLD